MTPPHGWRTAMAEWWVIGFAIGIVASIIVYFMERKK